ncbi:hypothetical protein F5J12DRAFT_786929 [Pisolithus orientalis]|uniref:uncharacterized protein n=1 Tax=Pisolithus orientalis TaxID=936130 RepID=UPI0022240338|nr:uncharacterized protein F5J12DRAFT_786929 [Pisolithus orientalis]KAI5988238.1 hypothetical protein F5J12DRAFT_786929 [Pisolithus orientalis]
MPPVRSQCARSQSDPPLVPHPVEAFPLLSLQAEIVYQQVWCVIVVAEQEMRPMSHQTSLENRKELCRAQSPQSSQMPTKDTSKSPQSQLPNQDTPKSPQSPKTKPPSEVGCPGRGGYNLKEHLRWSDDEMCKIKVSVKKYLDMMKSRSYQDFEAVQKVTGIARQQFLWLKDYEHCWPILNMIHLCLKYLSSRHWQKYISGELSHEHFFPLFTIPQLCHILCMIGDSKYNV